jgi:hypothetical protein
MEAATTTGVAVASRTSTVVATVPSTPAVAASVVAQSDPVVTPAVIAAAPPAQPWVVQTVSSQDGWQQAIAGLLATLTSTTQSVIGWLPVPDEFRQLVMGALWTTRRAFFNQAPVVAPVQITSQSTGPIAGRVDAVDPEGDPIVYRLVSGPTSGSVQVNADGTFTYTPGTGFNGFDSFAVVAQDVGSHVNLLNPFRAAGAPVGVLVNQGMITFVFNYTAGSQYWSADARTALQSAANRLARYLVVTSPVTLTYDVTGENSVFSRILASAGSGLIGSGAGFFRTVVQNKLIAGVDANGAAADGEINWNFGYAWGLGDSVGAGEYDFTSVVMHEVMHSLGFLSIVADAGSNTGDGWSVFDSFLETAGGTKVISPGYSWNSAFDDDLTGANGGLYFGGVNAVAAYGALVPVFTPNPFEPGSSMSHLDDATFTGANQQLMNAKAGVGPRVRALSPTEVGILSDLGYTVAPQAPAYALALVGIIFVRIPRRKSLADAS